MHACVTMTVFLGASTVATLPDGSKAGAKTKLQLAYTQSQCAHHMPHAAVEVVHKQLSRWKSQSDKNNIEHVS